MRDACRRLFKGLPSDQHAGRKRYRFTMSQPHKSNRTIKNYAWILNSNNGDKSTYLLISWGAVPCSGPVFAVGWRSWRRSWHAQLKNLKKYHIIASNKQTVGSFNKIESLGKFWRTSSAAPSGTTGATSRSSVRGSWTDFPSYIPNPLSTRYRLRYNKTRFREGNSISRREYLRCTRERKAGCAFLPVNHLPH